MNNNDVQWLEKQLAKQTFYRSLPDSKFSTYFSRFRLLGIRYLLWSISHRTRINFDVSVQIFNDYLLKIPIFDRDTQSLYYFGLVGLFEQPLTRFLAKNVGPDEIFYDIGANYGFYTFLASRSITEGEIHLFEPNRDIIPYLEQNIPQLSQNVFFCDQALSDRVGITTFFSAAESGASGISTTQTEIVEQEKFTFTSSEVSCTTLDEYASTHTPPTFIKLDVEGGELQVLEGARNMLQQHRPTIAMEIWLDEKGQSHSQKAKQFLADLGYKAYYIDSAGSLVTELPDLPNKGYVNMIFKKHG